MKKCKLRIVCVISAVFLLLFGAPFLYAQTQAPCEEASHEAADDGLMPQSAHFEQAHDLTDIQTTLEHPFLISPAFRMSLAAHSSRNLGIYMILMYILAFSLNILNKSFFRTNKHDALNYYPCSLVQIYVLHEADGKRRTPTYI